MSVVPCKKCLGWRKTVRVKTMRLHQASDLLEHAPTIATAVRGFIDENTNVLEGVTVLREHPWVGGHTHMCAA